MCIPVGAYNEKLVSAEKSNGSRQAVAFRPIGIARFAARVAPRLY